MRVRQHDDLFFYQISPGTITKKYTHSLLIKYILKNFAGDLRDVVYVKKPTGSIVGCNNDGNLVCTINPQQIVDTIKFNVNTYSFFKNYTSGNLTPKMVTVIRPQAKKILKDDISKLQAKIDQVASFYKNISAELMKFSKKKSQFNNIIKALKKVSNDRIYGIRSKLNVKITVTTDLKNFLFGYNIMIEVLAWMDAIYIFQQKMIVPGYNKVVSKLVDLTKQSAMNTIKLFSLLSIYKNTNDLLYESVRNELKASDMIKVDEFFRQLRKLNKTYKRFKKMLAGMYSMKF